jgi:hypothetical protein
MSLVQLPGDQFSAAELTNMLDLFPVQYGRFLRSGLFEFKGMRTNVAAIARKHHTLCLVPTSEWCGPAGAKNKRARKDMVFIPVPHTAIEGLVHPCDVMGNVIFDPNTEIGLESMEDEVSEQSFDMRGKLEMTLEYRMVRALFGEILDADGETLLHDLYKTFGYTRKVFTIDTTNPKENIPAKIGEIDRWIKTAYLGNKSGTSMVFDVCGFEAIVGHPSVQDAYKRCCDTQGLVTRMQGTGVEGDAFPLATSMITYYDASSCTIDPATGMSDQVNFMASPKKPDGSPYADECLGVGYPTGTSNNFETLGAPPSHNDFVGKKADRLFYESMEPRCHGEGYDLKQQMNALPIVKQIQANPLIIVKK